MTTSKTDYHLATLRCMLNDVLPRILADTFGLYGLASTMNKLLLRSDRLTRTVRIMDNLYKNSSNKEINTSPRGTKRRGVTYLFIESLRDAIDELAGCFEHEPRDYIMLEIHLLELLEYGTGLLDEQRMTEMLGKEFCDYIRQTAL